MTAERRQIRGVAVPTLFPASGLVHVLCVGEAPGPRGADKSGLPFFGDRAGLSLYRALIAAGACVLPDNTLTLPWDGAVFEAHQLAPELSGVALGNAFDRCPTDDGFKFRVPSRQELYSEQNSARLAHDVEVARQRGLQHVIALGRVAAQVMAGVVERANMDSPAAEPVVLHTVPHPSAQGLLSAAPNRGRGARLADLAQAWEQQLATLIRQATGSTP